MGRAALVKASFAAILVFALTACGGDNVNSTPAPEPTPAPTPAPTPTPTPPPPPPPNYTKLEDLAQPTTFNTAGVRWQEGPTFFETAALPLGDSLTVQVDPASDTYIVKTSDGLSATFTLANLGEPMVDGVNFRVPTDNGARTLSLRFPVVDNVPLTYTMIGQFVEADYASGQRKVWLGIGGAETLTTDMPKTGSATYRAVTSAELDTKGGLYFTTSDATATFGVDFGTGVITTSLHLIAAGLDGKVTRDFGIFNGTGSLTAGGPGFTGAFANTKGAGFSGAFFGPQALEMGYAYYFTDEISFYARGTTVGRKN